jgi:hypothetical protein
MMLNHAGCCTQNHPVRGVVGRCRVVDLVVGSVMLSSCLCRRERGSRLGEKLAALPVLLFHAMGAVGPVSAGGVGGYPTCQLAGTNS